MRESGSREALELGGGGVLEKVPVGFVAQLRGERPKDPTYQAFGCFGDPWTRLEFE